MPLIDYINLNYGGNQAAFGRAWGVDGQAVRKWVIGGWIAVNHVLYQPQRHGKQVVPG